ncbi:MAG: YqhA family protein [Synechococcaceae bacterium WB8_1B_136]|nr:YqhA family protein [Synechococcaceae bacterium WB8_1B_136]
MTRWSSRLEHRFERWLWRFRLIAILPVVMSLVSTAAAFVGGTTEILHALSRLLDGSPDDSTSIAKLLGELVGGVDLYLIGIALLIFGYGVYELLISDIEAARQTRGEGNGTGLLDIRSLDALKEKLVKVIVVALIVAGFKAMLVFPISTPNNLLVFSASVLLLALSAWLVAGGPKAKS